ncbi:HTH-type transcriptional repressor KstR2 [Roseovarius albus]|uniref:HTH-type transcriptional repressor KstR2 n=1 Tax=Roseovarius albus TaxID=1247867 RepID=A0A1X6YSK1_9RHOB|nr:TetR/AcrR family transcriptional regulator [Roseovarius albus]SLN29970.1 HTH-type transcriptional repressor KstR2 [Roseovarius albus]
MTSTRETITLQADTLFYENGFEATSFGDIAKAVGISRGNFYHHFKSKDAILDAVIELRLARTQTMLDNWSAEADPQERILSFVRILITNQSKIMAFGCPVGTLSSELAKLEHAAHPRAVEVFDLFKTWLVTQFTALGHGDKAKDHALHVLGRSQGVAVMAAAYQDPDFVQAEVDALEAWLNTLTPHN